MKSLLIWIQELMVVLFLVRLLWFWRKLYFNYKYLRSKYPFSIWKLPSKNMHLLNDEDRTSTRKLYIAYALHLVIGMIVLMGLTALVINYR